MPKEKKIAKKSPAAKEPVPEKKRARTAESAGSSEATAEPVKKLKKQKKMDVVAVEPAAPSPELVPVEKAAKKKKKASTPESTGAPPAKKKSAAASSSAPAVSPSAATAALLTARGGSAETRLDREQIARAVRALLTHVERTKKGGLLDADEAPIHVLVGTKQMPKAVGKAKACKPVALPLPFPYQSLETTQICVVTKDPQRQFKDQLAAVGLHPKVKVIGVSKLKKKYHPHEAKRELCASYDVFLADPSVLPMLPPLLGKTFFEKKKLPTAVNFKAKDLKAEFQRAACGTLYRHASGTSNSLQVGTTEQPAEHLVENVVAAVEQAVTSQVNGKWNNIQSLQLRSTNSIALPFYNAMPHA